MSFAPADLDFDPTSFVALLQTRAQLQASGVGGSLTFLGDDFNTPASESSIVEAGGCTRWNFADLDRKARSIAARLQRDDAGIAGERVLLLYPPGLEFLSAFFGCLYAGAIAVPAYLPRSDRAVPRLRGIVADAQPRAVLTVGSQAADLERWFAAIPELTGAKRWSSDMIAEADADLWRDPEISRDSIAFLQYTSGSTGAAKGVVVSHDNLLSNSAVIQQSFGSTRGSRGVSWLPLHHDMGLIGGALQAIYCGGSTTLFSPVAFLQRPVRWLELISRTGASISGGPNFAYDLCARRVTAEQKAGLDLSRWTVAFNGAEPIRADTIDRFSAAFAGCGFRRSAFSPCYGLAESTLLVSGGPPSLPPVLASLNSQAFDRGEIAQQNPAEREGKRIVGSGQTAADHTIAIVDPDQLTRRADHQVGEIWVTGPSIAQGYWNQPEATTAIFQANLAGEPATARYLRTGDLGFVRDGQLFVTGRLKDLIIVRGRNIYPQDVEWTVGRAHPGVTADAWAAFAVEVEGDDRLVVVGEIDRRTKAHDEVMAAVRAAVAAEFDLDLHAIALLKPMTLPRTSSGKVRRGEIRSQFLAKTLGGVAEWQADAPTIAPTEPEAALTTALNPSAATIAAWLVAKLAGPLGIPPAEVDPKQPFATFGLGSLRAVSLAGELEEWLGRSLSPTLLYEFPTVHSLARHLASESIPTRAPVCDLSPPTLPCVAADDRVAIIGIGCRFPGAAGPEAYWQLLSTGIDAVGPVSLDRQGDFVAPASTRAGFLDRVDLFDAAFFGIAPREAVWIDPQQRLLLEVAWEALEDGGQIADRLAGNQVGVFIGVATDDYARLHGGGRTAHEPTDGYALTGNAASIAANRISYTFDWRGPSLAVDTACSSSLVAIQLACRSLLAGESSLALAGGVNLILAPDLLADFNAAGFLAADSRCKTFDASADGYVRGEGAGVIVLKPLARAMADGDPIRAVIRGGAINQDGRSNGLTAPSRAAQEAVLRAAYQASGVEPGQIDYVEAHGTGTLLGDPIEARALGAVLAEGRPVGNRCWVGSAKTNIGHLEAAAGIAGTIKAALALEHGVIPPSLHFHQPNPHIPFADLPIAVAHVLTDWPATESTRLAGVSSFGFGGTNAHLVLESGVFSPGNLEADPPFTATHLLPISAKTGSSLVASARAIRDQLATGELDLADAAFSAGTRRAHFDHRLTLVARSATEAVTLLDAVERGETCAGVASGRVAPGQRPRLVFVYSGQGSQWLGMARDLLLVPAFRTAVEGVDRVVVALSGWSVLSALAIEEEDVRLLEPEIAQPLQFAVHVGLTALWRSLGIEPDVVVGHSLGEIAAAYIAGALPLGDAIRLIILRGRLTQRVIGLGRTVAAGLSATEAYAVVEASDGRIAVAAINGPTATTLSGDPDSILEQVDEWSSGGTFARLLNVDVAFHGPQMDPLAAELVDALAGLRPRATTIPLVSTVTGQRITGEALTPEYWGRNLRETVQFAAATQTLIADGFDTFLEVGPHPSLVASILATLREAGRDGVALGSIRRHGDGPVDFLQSLAVLYARGASVRWSALTPSGRFVRLPAYPWQRERFWINTPPPQTAEQPQATRNGSNGHHAGPESRAPIADRTADLLYEVAWHPVASPTGQTTASESGGAGPWVILADRGGVADQFQVALANRGIPCVVLPRGEEIDWPQLLDQVGESVGIVCFWGLDAAPIDPESTTVADLEVALAQGSAATLSLIQALDTNGSRARLWLVSAGAQAVEPGQAVAHPLQATTWGLGRSVRLHRGDAWGGLVDLDATDLLGSVAGLVAAVLDPDSDDEQAIRSGRRFAARLVRSMPSRTTSADGTIHPDATYLVTGGMGDLGLKAAEWLVGQGARRLILVGRRGLPPRTEWAALADDHPSYPACAVITGLERRGVTVIALAADIADEVRMQAVFDRIGELLPPVRGIIHAAGVVGPGSMRDTTLASWNQVLRSKVAGTWVLHRYASRVSLDFFASFSSIAATLGAKEPAYAAANHFLDAHASWATQRGLPTISIGWGPWAGEGMAMQVTRAHKILGLEPLRGEQALATLGKMLGNGVEAARHQLVADVDWFTFKVVRGNGRSARFCAMIDEQPGLNQDQASPNGLITPPSAVVEGWRHFPNDERRERVIGYFRDRVAGVLRLDPARVDPQRKLDTLGLDSLMAIELKSGVEADLGTSLPITSLLDGPTIAELADQAIEQWNGQPDSLITGPTISASAANHDQERHPLSPGQRSLWLVHQRMPADAAYNMAGAARVRGSLDTVALCRTLQVLVDRHASLRTTFEANPLDGEPEQIVHPVGSIEVGFSIVDATDWTDTVLTARLAEEARRPFDLAAAPPFRTTLFSRVGLDHHIVLSAHHIVGDFWSIALLMDELGAIYPADSDQNQATTGLPELRYTDYVRWQQQHLAGLAGERLRAYWGGVLRAPLPVLDLATDRPRPPVRTQRGGTRSLLIDAELASQVQALGAGLSASLYVTLLAAFQVLLGRLTGQTDVIVGSPVAGRGRAHLTDVVGYFANPLPIRANLADDPSFEDFVAAVRRAVFDGLDHQDLPFALMAEEFVDKRDPSRSPIFQAMFVFQKAQKLDDAGLTPFVLRGEGSKLALGNFALESVAVDLAASQFELTLATAETSEGLATTLEYNADLFDPATADRILARFETLLRSIVAAPATRLSDLSILSAAEWTQVVITPNQTTAPIPAECIHQVIQRQAELNPNAIAVAWRDVRLTYRDLNEEANRLACHLRSLGVGPESRVGLGVSRSSDLVLGILAILKAGGAYVPLDPEYPHERLAYLIADSGIQILLTQDAVFDRMPVSDSQVIRIDTDRSQWDQQPATDLVGGSGPDHAAYVIYTSGSTGRPKGVVVSHRNLMHSTHARSLHYQDPVESFLLLASFAHDTSVAGLFWTLIDGGRLVLPEQGWHADPDSLSDLIAEHRVTHWNSVPSLLRVVLNEAPLDRMATLKVIFLGGEACPLDLPGLVHTQLPAVTLHNEYGPTEATVWCTVHALGNEDETGGSVPIGHPIANSEAYVLDEQLRPVPVGVAGELYIGGAGVTRGYLDRPSLTAERFVPNPFADQPGARLYRTGDLARWRGNGLLDFLGRIDQQVKVRGYRIELGEVEAALIGHPHLAEAVAVAREDQPGDVRLVAYFVPIVNEPVPTAVELRRWLKERLPDSLVPTLFVPIDELPFSPNGKIDRKALPAPGATIGGEQRDEPAIAPRNPAEATLARLAAVLLGREILSVDDNFFDLGIDSIRAIQLVSRARQAGLGLDPGQVFDHPTVAALAGVAMPITPPAPLKVASTPEFSGGDVVEDYPLSPTQAGMLFHSTDRPESGMYVQQFLAPITSQLEIPAFEAAWRQVIDRHAVLRTSFTGWDGGQGRQLVHRRVPLPLEHRDWSHLSSTELASRLEDFLEADRTRGFAPNDAPLLRLTLIRIGVAAFRLVLSNHHALMDGWCAPIILSEMLACYEANLTNHPVQLPPTQPYRNYIEYLQTLDPIASEAYWRNELRGFREPTPLPMATALRSNPSREGEAPFLERSSIIPSPLVQDLAAMARRHRLTLSTVVAGAWGLILGRHSGRDDVVFGVTVSGRPAELPGVESMIGLFINTLPARVELSEGTRLSAWLAALQSRLVDARRHQSTPLAQIQRWADIPRGRSLFQSIVVFENTPDDPAAHSRAARLGVGPLTIFERTNFPLTLTVVPGDQLTLTARFDSGKIDAPSVDRLLEHVNYLLSEMVLRPDAPLAELALADASDQVVDGTNLSGFADLARLESSMTLNTNLPLLDRLDGLSDEEVDALLAKISSEQGAHS